MGRTTVNPPFNLARAVQLLIHASGPQEAATRSRLECGAIISVRERVAHVIAFPRPACLGDRHSVYDAGLGTSPQTSAPPSGRHIPSPARSPPLPDRLVTVCMGVPVDRESGGLGRGWYVCCGLGCARLHIKKQQK